MFKYIGISRAPVPLLVKGCMRGSIGCPATLPAGLDFLIVSTEYRKYWRTTASILGIATSFSGKAYGQIGQGLPIAASGLAILMGLNLLEVIELQLPSFFSSFDAHAVAANIPSSVQAYLAGLTFALAASPCSMLVLASLLGYLATTRVRMDHV